MSTDLEPRSNPGARASARPVAPSRDSVTTIEDDGSRRFLYPADARGRFTLSRRLVGALLIVVYVALPWIQIGGDPAVFLDLGGGRFHFFGQTLATQDTWLLFFGVTGLGFSLFFLTALFGRVWCGWACPQTVFLDHVFRTVERLIDGDAPARRELARAPLSPAKVARRILKHALYLILSLAITHVFLAYFVRIPEVWSMVRSAPSEHWAAFLFVSSAAALLYFNFAWFREQLCIVICPYGRLQSALTDDDTLVIGYDTARGEPRGKLGAVGAGDCISCNRCVQVCPTGIDIRQGLQMECIGCAACVDACNEVMTRIERPTGLVRYDSLHGLTGSRTRWIRPRTVVYLVLLALGAAVATFAFSTVKPAHFAVVRMTGAAYFVGTEGVRNQYMVRFVNKRREPVNFAVTLAGLPNGASADGVSQPVPVPAMGEIVLPLVLHVARESYDGPFHFTIRLSDEAGTFTLVRDAEFLGPDANLLREQDE